MRSKRFIVTSSMLALSAFVLANSGLVKADETTTTPSTTTSTQAGDSTAVSPVATTADTSTPATNSSDTTATPTNQPLAPVTPAPASTSTATPVPATPATTTATPVPTAPVNQTEKNTLILHTNDIHGRMEEASGVIGLPKLATLVETEKAKTDQTTLVLDAGDAFQGLPISNASKGDEMLKAMNAIGYDAMAVGNHEFDFSLEKAKEYKEKLTFPLLSANTYIDGARLFEASTIIDKDKTVVGDEFVVIGVTTPETSTKTHPNNVKNVTFADPIAEVKKVIEQTEATAKATGADYKNYIILAHLGIDASTPEAWRGDTLAKVLSEYAPLAGKKVIVIDGHSHSVHNASYGTNVTYNQSGSYLNNIGKIEIAKDGTVKAGLITAGETKPVSPNAQVGAIVAAAKAAFEKENAVVVVPNNTIELNGDRENVRVRETNLGNIVADALYDYGQTGFAQPSDLAVTNGGGLRATIKPNQPITRGDIIAVLPFGNSISQIEVKGDQILQMFERSLSSAPQADKKDDKELPLLSAAGFFLHTSGVRTYFDPNATAGQRVLKVEILDRQSNTYKPLDTAKTYYLATNDFLAAGGDGYTMLGGARQEGPSMDTVFANFLANQQDLSHYAKVNTYLRTIPLDPKADDDKDGRSNTQELADTTDPAKVTKALTSAGTLVTVDVDDASKPLELQAKHIDQAPGSLNLNLSDYDLYDLKLVPNDVSDNTILVRLPKDAGKTVEAVYHVSDDGQKTSLTYKVTNDDKFVEFTVPHFSYYVIAYKPQVTNPGAGNTTPNINNNGQQIPPASNNAGQGSNKGLGNLNASDDDQNANINKQATPLTAKPAGQSLPVPVSYNTGKSATLPNTGDNSSDFAIYGVGLLSLVGLIAFIVKKRKDQD